jgi:hypothetical protein
MVRRQVGMTDVSGGGVIVIVVGGSKGNGFSCQADLETTLALPDMLEGVARQIRERETMKERTPLQAKLDRVSRPKERLTKRETVARMSKALAHIYKARVLRRAENVAAGRIEDDDDIVGELDAAEDILTDLGASPPVRS